MLQKAIQHVFVQLSASLEQLSDEQYTQPCTSLFNATIGQHLRHIIELYQCLECGYESGIVNYDKRKRDAAIENDKQLAHYLLIEIYAGLDKPNKGLTLENSFEEHSTETIFITTNYYREVAYNLEHTVHHMALIRVGINEVSQIELPETYGVASSTTKFKQACAQ